MQPKFTQKFLRSFSARILVLALVLVSFTKTSDAQVLYSEGFNIVVPLPAGWASQNNSSPVGTTGWFQGNPLAFPSQSGAPNAYIAANFQNTTGVGTISNWLFAPTVTMTNGDLFTFWTRVPASGGGVFPDRLQVRLSPNGASTNVGATATSVGDFTVLLLDINPTYSTTAYPAVWTQFTVTVSGLAVPTSGRFAFRYFVENGGPAGANSDYIGIDEVVYTKLLLPCAGTPNPGTTNISTPGPSVCSGVNFTLSPQNATTGSGITYQWQSSSDGIAWNPIPGAIGSSYTTFQTTATHYRVQVTCSAGPSTGNSTGLLVSMNPSTACYCTPTYTFGCAAGDFIARVRIGTLDNASACSTPPFTYYNTVAAPTLIVGGTYPLQVTVGPDGFGQNVAAWIDFNQDGDYADAGEFVGGPVDAGANGTANIPVTIPAGTPVGTTRLRIRGGDDDPQTAGQSCGASNSPFGEAEDYNINIAPCITGAFTAQPANATVPCSGNATFSATHSGSAVSYFWEQRVNAASPWTIVPGATSNTLTLNNVPSTSNGYQYRVVVTGPCTAIDFSNAATLTVTPLVATVSPTSATICAGQIQQLTLTNASSPATSTFNATGMPMAIPDGNPTGVSNTVVASGIPAGAVVSNVSITFTMTHTWVGDIVMNLTAPNGQTLNLVGALDNGMGLNSTNDFTGTVISSTGTTPLSGAPAPRTGVFAADRFTATVPTIAPTTTNNWAALLAGAMNGNWRLAMCDLVLQDVGNLLSWSLSITYGAPAAGVWTANPAAPNSMFTNAAATTPYVPGSQANTIWVMPANTTTYSVVYSTATPCVSAPTNITVNVVKRATAIVNPATPTSVCVGGTANFTSSASGGPFTYQWVVSTNGGATYTPIAGATSPTLSLPGVTQTMHNNRYRLVFTAPPCTASDTSGAAILTVNPLPVVTLTASQTAITPGQTATLTANSTPGPLTATSWVWLYNGAVVAGNTNTRVVGIDDLGSYQVRVTDANNCVNTSNTVVIGAQPSDRLWIYPNPTNGQFQVRIFFNGPYADVRDIRIFNAQGQQVMYKAFDLFVNQPPYMKMDFDMRRFPAGTYVVRVQEQFTGNIKSGLLIIQ